MTYATRSQVRPPTIKERHGMYTEQFELLENGDVIKGRGGDLRIIEDVHKRDGRTYSISLLKLRPSWTRGNYTTYCSGDSLLFTPVKVKNEKIWEFTYEKIIAARKKAYLDYKKQKLEEIKNDMKNKVIPKTRIKKPYVGEIEDRLGVFTIGKVKDVYEAHTLFLDWYYDYMKDADSRRYFEEYWSVSPQSLEVEHIQEVEAATCPKCGMYSLDDTECYQCEDQRLDMRTKFKSFTVSFV